LDPTSVPQTGTQGNFLNSTGATSDSKNCGYGRICIFKGDKKTDNKIEPRKWDSDPDILKAGVGSA